jgi:coenzyme F420-reducing hydrogenase alpha subunit
MLTVDKVKEAKEKYKEQAEYFSKISFDTLANQFNEMVELCGEMIDVVEELNKIKETPDEECEVTENEGTTD